MSASWSRIHPKLVTDLQETSRVDGPQVDYPDPQQCIQDSGDVVPIVGPPPADQSIPSATPEVRRKKVGHRRRDRDESVDLGWIKLCRSLLDHPRYRDAVWLQVWVFLLLKATHTSYRVLFDGADTLLAPGQLITSRKSIVEYCGAEPSKVERILKTLEREQQIDQRSCSTCRLITILNWDEYQRNEQPNDQRVNSERPADEQRVNTHKKVQKDENGKNPPHAPQGGFVGGEEVVEGIYRLYPRKTGKRAPALQAIRMALTKIDADTLRAAVTKYTRTPGLDREDGRWIPLAVNWFTDEAWKDYIPKPPAPTVNLPRPSRALEYLRNNVLHEKAPLSANQRAYAAVEIGRLTPEDDKFITDEERTRIDDLKAPGVT